MSPGRVLVSGEADSTHAVRMATPPVIILYALRPESVQFVAIFRIQAFMWMVPDNR